MIPPPPMTGASSELFAFLRGRGLHPYQLPMACERVPGQPYRPMLFASEAEAGAAVGLIGAALCPPAAAEQEVYFNTRNFIR